MVRDRITDGKRIGQLLASELTGLSTGPLSDVAVVDADRDAEPTPEGTFAYAVEYEGERIGTVDVYENEARLTLSDVDAVSEGQSSEGSGEGIAVTGTADGLVVRVESGAAVKRAVDLLADALAG